MTLNLPTLRDDQARIKAHPAKIKVLCAGRRYGKTVLGGEIAASAANRGEHVAWVAPTYKNSRPLWRWAERIAQPHIKDGVSISKSDRVITFPSGGMLGIYSADSPVSIRGEAFHVVIVDEAARVAEDAMQDAILPTLADHDGTLLLISTPNRKNWFYVEYMRALSDGKQSAAWHAPTSANPSPNIRKAFELARERVPAQSFKQEWLAEFIDEGAVFRNVRECATLEAATPDAHAGHRIVGGIDWGQANDYTVIKLLCATCNQEVASDRFNAVSWNLQRGRLKALCEAWHVAHLVAESNSIGSPNIEALQSEGLPIMPFETTATSKPPLIQSLILAFEKSELQIINDSITINELESYEEKRNAVTNRVTYSAPSGMHDDTVMGLALAWFGKSNFNFISDDLSTLADYRG